MEFLRRIFQERALPVSDPARLPDALFTAANSGDSAALLELCAVNRDAILQHFGNWTNLHNYPGLDPKDSRQVQYVFNGLAGTATLFRDKLKDPALWNSLAGPKDTNPFTHFDDMFGRAKALTAEHRYGEAADLLTGFLIDTKNLAGHGADTFRSYCHGLLGHCRFQANRSADAIDHYQQALSLCGTMGDGSGVAAYLASLFEAHRYLGQSEEAAGCADRLAEHHGETVEGRRWRTRADVVRRGEPLLRMIAQQGGRILEIEQIEKMEGEIQFLFERNRRTLAPSEALVGQGDQFAGKQQYEEALSQYRDAASADPFNPQAHYLAGLTLLILQRYPQAVEEYEATARLAPGWFQVGSDLWIANELLAGRLAHEAFMALWLLQDGTGASPAQRLELADQVMERFPPFAHIHLVRAAALEALGAKPDARAALERGLDSEPEPDVRSRMLVRLAVLSDRPARRELFEQVLSIPSANLMARTMAEVMFSHPGP